MPRSGRPPSHRQAVRSTKRKAAAAANRGIATAAYLVLVVFGMLFVWSRPAAAREATDPTLCGAKRPVVGLALAVAVLVAGSLSVLAVLLAATGYATIRPLAAAAA